MMACGKDFFTYETTKSVVVKSWTVGIINRVMQLLIISYFVGWVFLYEKAYQIQDTAIESSVMTKVKGSALYNSTVMDMVELVAPSQGSSVFSIITNIITTEKQVQDYCPESDAKYHCGTDEDCEKHMLSPGDKGITTGRCVPFNDSKSCEIRGWCPAEIDTIETSPMMEVENFTIFIKNSIRFPLFNFTRANFLASITEEYIKSCHFDEQNNTFCPIFRVGDVVRLAQQNFSALAEKGGVIGIKISWVCDLDKSEEHCQPSYSFKRLDAFSAQNKVSKGYNFRYANYFKENETEYRTLRKAFAIRFDVLVNGNARKFNVIPTVINVVAAFTSVGLGTVLCDIILLNFLKGADHYKAKKFEEVPEFQTLPATSHSNVIYRSSCAKPNDMQFEALGDLSNGQQG